MEEYLKLYRELEERTGSDSVALAVLQEIAKDRRTERIGKSQQSEEPATVKQIALLEKLGVDFPDRISKKEASVLISEKLEQRVPNH